MKGASVASERLILIVLPQCMIGGATFCHTGGAVFAHPRRLL